jgi:hypothetical protein
MLSNSYYSIDPKDAAERAYLESLIRDDYALCHPGETLEDMKRRAAFSKEDKGLYRDWLAVAARRSTDLSACVPFSSAAE